MQGYVWDDKSLEDKPVKVSDHACDALRYFVKTKRILKQKRMIEKELVFL
jgi:phage terminase large subunit